MKTEILSEVFDLNVIPKETYVFVIPDNVIDIFCQHENISTDDFLRRYNFDNLTAKISTHKNNYVTTDSDIEFSFDFLTLDGIEVLERNGNMFYISGIPMTQEQYTNMKYDINYLETMPFDVFLMLITTGELIGRDLISLCSASSGINKKCKNNNEQIYRIALRQDFGIPYTGPDAKKMYVEILNKYANDTLWTWGSGYLGQLGYKMNKSNIPRKVKGVSNIRYVSCGRDFTAFVTTDGYLYTFGANHNGQLGLGNTTNVTNVATPTLVTNIPKVKNLSCGPYHTVIITNYNDAYGFGYAKYGQLGKQDYRFILSPTIIPNLPKIEQVSCGYHHTGIVSVDNNLYIFGIMFITHNTISTTPVLIDIPKIKQVACGQDFTVAITLDGDVFVQGMNTASQLGLGDTINRDNFVKVPNLPKMRQASCGSNHTALIAENNVLYMSGSGNALPRITYVFRETTMSNVLDVSCGDDYTAAIVENGDSTELYTWGSNMYGQLGIGANNNRERIPLKVDKLKNIIQVACGDRHTACITY